MINPLKGRIVTNHAEKGAIDDCSFTVPANKRWVVLWGYSERDQNSTLDVDIYDISNNLIGKIKAVSAGTTSVTWVPKGKEDANIGMMFCLLEVGMYIKYTYGATQTSPKVTCVVLEYDL